jgi:hypothetical protein
MTTVSATSHRNFVPDFRPGIRTAPVAQASRREAYPERAPGVGYGNSSGYASVRRYARGWTGQPLFRCG